MTPSLVCFDLGNVLVRLAREWEEAFARAGVGIPEQFDDEQTRVRHERCLTDFETGKIDEKTYFRIASRYLKIDVEKMTAVYDVWIDGMQPCAGDMLDRLAATGVHTACLSNTSERHWHVMLGSGPRYVPLRRLRSYFASHLIGVMKPDSRIYQHVERNTKVAPEAILFFDDNDANIEAARRRHWHAELIDPAADPVRQMMGHLQRYGLL